MKLYHDLFGFESLVGFLDPLRREYEVGDSAGLAEIFGEVDSVGLTALTSALPELRQLASGIDPEDESERDAINRLLMELDALVGTASMGPAIFPPHAEADDPLERAHLIGMCDRMIDHVADWPEVKLNRWKLFTNALVFYLLAFLLLAGTWLAPKAKLLRAGVWGSVSLATALVISESDSRQTTDLPPDVSRK